jgi:beta-glucuronidase
MLTHNRKSIDLNGTWKFCPDPMQRCRRQKWWATPPVANSFGPCWDEDGLWDIQVPGTWKTQFEELKWYDGHAVYMKNFEASLCRNEEAFLVFDGVVYESEVYLNGQYMAKHDWGYSAHAIRVTDALSTNNQLFVLIDNHLSNDRVPGEIFDWSNDGGLINGVKLVYVPRTHIENFRLQTTIDGDTVHVDVDIKLESRDRRAAEEVTVEIPEIGLTGKVTVAAGEQQTIRLSSARANVSLWSPENPKLYDVQVKTQHEEIVDKIGLREIKTEKDQIILNGEPIRLYGVSMHSEFPDTGRTATDEGIQKVIEIAKDLGLNFLRCAHYPYAEKFGRALDEAGLMWWEEVPAYWLPNMAEPHMTEKACGMMRETVIRDWNRASLIMWSVSNECCWKNPQNDRENNYGYWRTVVPMVRELDPSRLVTAAEAGMMIAPNPVWDPSCGDEFQRDIEDAKHWRTGHADEIYDLFDVLAANIYVNPGEAKTAYASYVQMLKPYNKPLMLSEFGGCSLRGASGKEEGRGDDHWGVEERHIRLIEEAYESFKELPELVGYSPWCLCDIRVPIHWRWFNKGKGIFRFGFIDEEWQPKKAYPLLKKKVAELKKFFR